MVGISDTTDKASVLVIGDISFKYDLNSLYMLQEISERNITIVIINNYGGGIFELLPIVKDTDYLNLLTTPHRDNFEKVIQAFPEINYEQVCNKNIFIEAFKKAKQYQGINIIEVLLDSSVNKEVYQALKTVKL